jgi:hypothetical protein
MFLWLFQSGTWLNLLLHVLLHRVALQHTALLACDVPLSHLIELLLLVVWCHQPGNDFLILQQRGSRFTALD